MKLTKCPTCSGSGKIPDRKAQADDLRKQRVRRGVSLRFVADKLGISAPYLSDLERGNRAWSDEMIAAFKKALA